MKITSKMLLVLFALFFGFAVTMLPVAAVTATDDQIVVAQDDDDWDDWDDEEEEDAFGNIMQMSFTSIEDVTFETPDAGADCTVTAKITLEDEDEEATLSSVKLVYSVNGGAEAEADMSDNGDGTWSGAIPGQAAGSKVDFYIKTTDSNNNVSTGAISGGAPAAGVADIDNSEDIVVDDADLLNISANYDDEYLYFNFDVQGNISGGTVDPPYIQLYGVKITNPDTDEGEGLMVGTLWVYLPLAKDKEVQEKFMPLLLEQGQEYVEKIGIEKINRVKDSGMLVLQIQKLMGGNIMEGLLFDADPEATTEGGKFQGKIKRAALGENPSGQMRFIVITAANASLDSFMPIPLNCSNFIQLYTSSNSYTVPGAPAVAARPLVAGADELSVRDRRRLRNIGIGILIVGAIAAAAGSN